MMPGIDGNVLCRTLKSDPETDFVPIILLTALASTDDRVTGLGGGADDYLAKPFEKCASSRRGWKTSSRLGDAFVSGSPPRAWRFPRLRSSPR